MALLGPRAHRLLDTSLNTTDVHYDPMDSVSPKARRELERVTLFPGNQCWPFMHTQWEDRFQGPRYGSVDVT